MTFWLNVNLTLFGKAREVGVFIVPKMAIFGQFALRYRETVRVLNTEMVLCFEPRNGHFRRKHATVELKPFKQDDVLIICKPYIVWEVLRS